MSGNNLLTRSRKIITIRGKRVPPVRTIKKRVIKYRTGLRFRLNSAWTPYFAIFVDAFG